MSSHWKALLLDGKNNLTRKDVRIKVQKVYDRAISLRRLYSINRFEQRGVYRKLVISPLSCLMMKIMHHKLK